MKFASCSSIAIAVVVAGCGTQSGEISDARVSFADDAAVLHVDAAVDAGVISDAPVVASDSHVNAVDAAPETIDASLSTTTDAAVASPDAREHTPTDAPQPTTDAPAPTIDAGVVDATPSIDAGRPTHINAIPTGNRPWQVVTADFNADGLDDLAVSNFNDGTVTVLLANFVDGFEPGVNYYVGTADGAMSAGDLNNDGVLDLVVPNWDGNVSILLGNVNAATGLGDGTFTVATNDSTDGASDDSYAIGIADLDGDGFPDLAIASAWNGDVSVLLGNGDGTFKPFTAVHSGVLAVGLSIADFNFDGALDIAVADTDKNTLGILFGNLDPQTGTGDGTFAPIVTTFTTDAWPVTVLSNDFNGDGVLDLVIVNQQSSDIGVLLGIADSNAFAGQITYPVTDASKYPADAKLADFNGDGVLDIVCASVGDGGDLAVLLGNVDADTGDGDGTFAAAVHLPVGADPGTVAVGDFNGDGALDIATANGTDGTVSILLGDGNGNFH